MHRGIASSTEPKWSALGLDHLAPAGCLQRAHQLAEQMLPAYSVSGGQIHLAGCRLEDVPILRFESSGRPDLRDWIRLPGADEFCPVSAALAEQLGLDSLQATSPPGSISVAAVAEWIDEVNSLYVERDRRLPEKISPDQIIWCKFARGKVQFTVGEEVAEQSFAQWSHRLKPPAYQCAVTGTETYQLAATSDGRVIAQAAIDRCEITGQRLPQTELVRCAVTGKTVAESSAMRCPITGEFFLTGQSVHCAMCQQSVSPGSIRRHVCRACRTLKRVGRDENDVLSVLGLFPALTHWRSFRVGFSTEVMILIASRGFQRRLLVVDRNTGLLRYAASKPRWGGRWTSIDARDVEEGL